MCISITSSTMSEVEQNSSRGDAQRITKHSDRVILASAVERTF